MRVSRNPLTLLRYRLTSAGARPHLMHDFSPYPLTFLALYLYLINLVFLYNNL